MEWTMPVNEMLHDEITKLDFTLVPPGFRGDVRSVRVMKDSLAKLIDHLGEQSATAQRLKSTITTTEKLRNSNYTLYLIKDANANGGKGEVVGMLKVGRKHLFLFDERVHLREFEPLCVLDFYVVGDRQRHGYGKKLFDYMLNDQQTSAHRLAIDGPSPYMNKFLTKNYNMGKLVQQNNNFAVSAQFFENYKDDIGKSGASTSSVSTPSVSTAVGRYSAPKPQSSIANVIHGGVPTNDNYIPNMRFNRIY